MRKIVVLVILVLIFSCGEKVIEAPGNLISKDKMKNILYDLAIINAAKGTNPKILEEKRIAPMEYVFKKHGIDSIQFVESDTYYASLPNEYEEIYKSVESRLEKEKKQKEERRTKSRDSAQNISVEQKKKLKQAAIKKTAQDSLP